ncbi:MAG: extracellular solute-binding protein [Paracoccus denitrificans]|uniref:Extracellular solute-binding protein n=1 Tax=Paracoccus denitrificans TaxID=266 RepID=A0A533I7K3_PARDE|nr:MAG: extracellular solute-binding protein [Paracoccus denitrificans]
MTVLKGMTWNHPRGYDPMVAVSAEWQRAKGVAVHWDKRSLQDFESYPVEKLAREYDLIVIDHPHVGQITAEGCLHPLPDAPEIARASVGLSYPSYTWQGKQWAYPIDAATQVQAIRPDLTEPPATWEKVLELARSGRVAIPLRAPHSLMSFLTLVANAGHPVRTDGPGQFVDRAAGIAALERLSALAALVDPDCYGWDPIDVLERMASGDDIACAPLTYGYVSYSHRDARGKKLSFHDIPETSPGAGVAGSALGGTGIAVSAFSAAPEAAIAFARHIAGPEVQRGIYAGSGGQVGHGEAWADAAVDAEAGGFYSGTARTLDGAALRPRHDGYMPFQDAASARIVAALKDGDFAGAVDDMDRLFVDTFKRE